MSDTCHMSFRVKLSDLAQFKAVISTHLFSGFEFDEENDDDGVVELVVYAANHGFYSEIQAMVKDPNCPPFHYFQGVGSTYAAENGVFFGNFHPTIIVANDSPVVTISPAGINCGEIYRAYLYFELLEGFEAYCRGKPMADYYTHLVIQPFIPKDLITGAELDILASFGIESKSVLGESHNSYLYAEEYRASGYDYETNAEYEEDFLIKLLQGVIKRSNGALNYITFELSYNCSKMRPDGFGGAAVFITENDTEWLSTYGWLEEKIGSLDSEKL